MQAKPLTDDIFENFTIIVDKNKINHHTPLPQFSELRKMNLPGFRKYYSEELFANGIYKKAEDIKEAVSILTVFGIKYKYLNRKKCFPTKLTNEQLKLKKAFVCLEILKVFYHILSGISSEEFNKKLSGGLEKITQHFEDTWKESEYSFEDEFFTIAVWNLGLLYSKYGENAKTEEFSNKIVKTLKSYIAKSAGGKTSRKSLEILYNCLQLQYNFLQNWTDKMAFKISKVMSKIITDWKEDYSLFQIQQCMTIYCERQNYEKILQNANFIRQYVRNKMKLEKAEAKKQNALTKMIKTAAKWRQKKEQMRRAQIKFHSKARVKVHKNKVMVSVVKTKMGISKLKVFIATCKLKKCYYNLEKAVPDVKKSGIMLNTTPSMRKRI